MDSPVILWFRDDLRLSDHAALDAALAAGRPLLALYVLDETSSLPPHWALGGAARWWLHHSLTALSADLRARGGGLVLRRGRAVDIVPALAEALGASAVYTGGMADPQARAADRAIAAQLETRGVRLHRMRTATLYPPDRMKTKAGTPYTRYTPFLRACLDAPPAPPSQAPARMPPMPACPSDRLEDWAFLPTRPDWAGGLRAAWGQTSGEAGGPGEVPGEAGAKARLARFAAQAVEAYPIARDRVDQDGSSSLSPYLRFGEVSPVQVWHAVGADNTKFLQELLWREFCHYLLWHNPALPDTPWNPAYPDMPWRDDPEGLRAWQKGETGVPIVDAAMRQLWETGWMHNRARMITASFLVKHLLIDWREGERWFWDTLVDADLANNAVNWQWIAGSGPDAAPFFRVFNPVLQGQKVDPDGAYVRRYAPEYGGVDSKHIHASWEAPSWSGPRPIVDLAEGRDRALAVFRAARGGTKAE